MSSYLQCNLLLAKGQYREAKDLALAGLADDPNDAYLVSALARSFRGLNDPLQAMKFAEQAVAIEPHDADFLAELAYMQQACGSHDKAVETLAAARSLNPNSSFALRVSIDILLGHPKRSRRSEMLNTAREIADIGVMTFPHSAAMNVADGQVHLAQKQAPAAEVSARRALGIDPNNAAALNLLADATAKQGRSHEAGDYYIQAARADPTDSQALEGLREMSNGKVVFLAVVLILIFVILGSLGGPSIIMLPLIMAAAIGAVVFIGDAMTKRSQQRMASKKLNPDAQNILDQDRRSN